MFSFTFSYASVEALFIGASPHPGDTRVKWLFKKANHRYNQLMTLAGLLLAVVAGC